MLAAAGAAVRTVLPVPPAAAPPDVGWPPPRPMYGRIPATMSSTLDALGAVCPWHDLRAAVGVDHHQIFAALTHRRPRSGAAVGEIERRRDVAIDHLIVAIEHDVADHGLGGKSGCAGDDREQPQKAESCAR